MQDFPPNKKKRGIYVVVVSYDYAGWLHPVALAEVLWQSVT
jgi:hypothetical protein